MHGDAVVRSTSLALFVTALVLVTVNVFLSAPF